MSDPPLARAGAQPFRERVRTARQALLAAQKTPRGVSLYSIHVNRPLGRWGAALAAAVGATPNAVTLASAACSLAGILVLALAPRHVAVGVVVAVLLAAGFVLDSSDGQVARLTGTGSVAGEWLDHMLDAVTKLGVHIAVLVGWRRAGGGTAALALPLAFQAVMMLVFLGGTLAGQRLARTRPPTNAAVGRLSAVGLLPVDYGVFCLAFVTWGFRSVFPVVYAGLLAIYALFLVAFSVKWYAELRAS